jgi:hypothetical protein
MPKKTRKTESDPRWGTMGILGTQPWMLGMWLDESPKPKPKRRRKTAKKASKW